MPVWVFVKITFLLLYILSECFEPSLSQCTTEDAFNETHFKTIAIFNIAFAFLEAPRVFVHQHIFSPFNSKPMKPA